MNDCPTIRTKLVTYSTINMMTGKSSEATRQERITEPCGTPLFGHQATKGICKACEDGWQVDDNKPATQGELEHYQATLKSKKS